MLFFEKLLRVSSPRRDRQTERRTQTSARRFTTFRHGSGQHSRLRLVHSTRTEQSELNRTQFENSRVNWPDYIYSWIHMLRTNRALTVLVSLQPVNTKYSCDANARDQWAHRATGSTCSGQFSSVIIMQRLTRCMSAIRWRFAGSSSDQALTDRHRVGQKAWLFSRVDNFATVRGGKGCDMSEVFRSV